MSDFCTIRYQCCCLCGSSPVLRRDLGYYIPLRGLCIEAELLELARRQARRNLGSRVLLPVNFELLGRNPLGSQVKRLDIGPLCVTLDLLLLRLELEVKYLSFQSAKSGAGDAYGAHLRMTVACPDWGHPHVDPKGSSHLKTGACLVRVGQEVEMAEPCGAAENPELSP